MKKGLWTSFLMVMVLALGLAACSNDSEEVKETEAKEVEVQEEAKQDTRTEQHGVIITDKDVTFTDTRGQEVTIEKNPKRVVSVFNSYIEIWMASGGEVVGTIEPSGDKPVPGTENAEIVGTLGAVSLEKVLSLEPDVVIVNGNSNHHMELVPSLEQSGIKVIALDFVYKEDYFKLARVFTALTGREDLYEQNVNEVNANIEKIIAESPTDKNYKVLLMMASGKSITARGTDSYVGEMLKDLHTTNIADVSNNLLSETSFSMEKIIEEDPDFIFVQTTGSDMQVVYDKLKQDVESNPAWASLQAVQNERYIFLPKDLYMYKANQRYAEAYEGLAQHLYGE